MKIKIKRNMSEAVEVVILYSITCFFGRIVAWFLF